jgi:hypothetical protein
LRRRLLAAACGPQGLVRVSMLALGILSSGVGTLPVLAQIDLELRPVPPGSYRVGDLVEVGLYAVSSDPKNTMPTSGMQVIFQWDPGVLELVGADNNGPVAWLLSDFFDDSALDGLNNSFADGDAYYQAASSILGPADVTPEGLLVTTLQFNAVGAANDSVVEILPAAGTQTETDVFGAAPGEIVTGSLGSALVTVVPAVDWGVLIVEDPNDECCLLAGDSVTVAVRATGLLEPINGVQALLRFDENQLALDSILAGDGAGSPWDSAIVLSNNSGGDLTVGALFVADSTDVDAVVARLEFTMLFDGPSLAAVVEILPEVLPLVSKFTLASDATTIVPALVGPATFNHAGDRDRDGDIDLSDYADLVGCVTGSVAAGPLGPCEWFDLDRDGDVDAADFGLFQIFFTGPLF